MVKIGKINVCESPLILAPMEDVTDSAFRKLCKSYGADIHYTEFIASDALVRKAQRSFDKLVFDPIERPIGIQIFGKDPQVMAEAAIIAESYNPDFIDLNFGCPVKKVVSKGGGAALLNDLDKMLEITKAVVNSVNVPVTVKTRLGWDEKNKPIVALAEQLQDVGVAALAIHARTKSQMYGGNADWTLIGEVKNNQRMCIPIFGNGDIDSPETALEKINKYGVDGLMIGRAAIGNPWIFKRIKTFFLENTLIEEPTLEERVNVCKNFLLDSVKNKGEKRGIFHLRRHYGRFFKSYPNIKNIRMKLVTSSDVDEIIDILESMRLES